MQLQRRRCCRHISLLQLQPPPLQLFHGVNRGVTMNLTLKSIHRTVIEQLVTYEKWQASTRKAECPQRRLPQKFQTCPFFLDKRWGDMSWYFKKKQLLAVSLWKKNTFFVCKTKAFGSTCRPGGRSYGQTSPPLAPLPATGGVFVDSKKWKPSNLSWKSQKITKNLWMFILAIFTVSHTYSCSLFYENVFVVSFWRLLCQSFCKAPSQLSVFFGKPCRPCCFPFRGDAWDGNEGGWISHFSSERFIR